MICIYVPILRQEIFGYVKLWNVHNIRKQKCRPNVPTGKPWMLYHHPPENVKDYACEPDSACLDVLCNEVADYGKLKDNDFTTEVLI